MFSVVNMTESSKAYAADPVTPVDAPRDGAQPSEDFRLDEALGERRRGKIATGVGVASILLVEGSGSRPVP